MTREEQWIKESIENYIFAYTGKRAKISDTDAQYFTACVKAYLNLCTPSLPSNLDDAAEEYAMQQIGYADKEMAESSYAKHNKLKVTYFSGYDLAEAFDAGAKWMAKQDQKDQELTINDLKLLHTFLYAVKNNKQGCFTFTRLSDEQYQEVLKRFQEAKK